MTPFSALLRPLLTTTLGLLLAPLAMLKTSGTLLLSRLLALLLGVCRRQRSRGRSRGRRY
jgi:hypothetical protein